MNDNLILPFYMNVFYAVSGFMLLTIAVFFFIGVWTVFRRK